MNNWILHISLDPILFQWRQVSIGWHGVAWVVGLCVALWVFIRECDTKGIDSAHLVRLIVCTILGGYAGARLLYVAQHWDTFAAQPIQVLMLHQGGIRLFGALAGIILAVAAYAWHEKLPFWMLADALAVGLPTAEAIGRTGCTLNGDIWGIPTRGPWGVVYWHPNASIPSHLLGVPLFPVPLTIQIWSAGVLLLVLTLRKRSLQHGTLCAASLFAYSLGRLVIGTWQAQSQLLFQLKQTQVSALACISLATVLLLCLRAKASRIKR
jgi:phosphatidylglycerol:prolipoprotein diacylglycerol transferase